MPINFRNVTEQIYAGGAPSIKDLKYLKEILGIKTIVSLDANIASKISPILYDLKIKHIIIPIDSSNSQINDNIRYLQRNIVNILSNQQPVYIHCLHGSDRTGLAIALYRILKNNWKCKQAINEAKRFQFGQRLNPATQKNWTNFLCALSVDNQAVDDITTIMRENFDDGNLPPAFNPQQSWAPFESLTPNGYNPNIIDYSKFRQELLLDILSKQLPIIGLYNNLGPMRGFGPIENSGILQLI